jgi:hypothetical protein
MFAIKISMKKPIKNLWAAGFFDLPAMNATALQSLTGKYREIQGKPCNENRDPAMRTGFPCNESRFFPVGINLQGKAVSCTGFGFTVCL